MQFKTIENDRSFETARPINQQTARAYALIAEHAQSPLPSNIRFMARTIQEFVTHYGLQFEIRPLEKQGEVICYQSGQPISREEVFLRAPERMESEFNALPLANQVSGLEHAMLMGVYKAMLKSMQQQYQIGIRLAIQQHDMLPLVAEQTCIIQNKILQQEPFPPAINEEQHAEEKEKIRDKRMQITMRAQSASDPASPSRKLNEIEQVEEVDIQTLDTLATLKAIGKWIYNSYLEDVSAIAIDSVTNDAWKQARIQNATHWSDFEHIFQDGIGSQFDIIVNLLTYHAYVSRVSIPSLSDALDIVTDPKFNMTLHALLGAPNGENVNLFFFGNAPIDFLTTSYIPEISKSGKAYLKEKLRAHNQHVAPNVAQLWDSTKITDQPQRRCVAAVHSAKLRVADSELPQPGDSTTTYIDHLLELAHKQPGIFQMTKTDGIYTLTMQRDPITFLTQVFALAVANAGKQPSLATV